MMVAERPIKRNELEIGIVLDQRTPEITTASKIRGDVFTLCNPIVDVEDGPTEYVSFCHSTALELALAASIRPMYYLAHRCFQISTGIPTAFSLDDTSGAFDRGLILRAIFDLQSQFDRYEGART